MASIMTAGPPSVQTQLAVVQATPFCNIRCRYCYLPDRGSSEVISMATLERIADQLSKSRHVRDALTVVWHAGEPLRLPIQFYREAFDVFRNRDWGDVDLSFSMQTNAMMINQSWCDLFSEYKVNVGVSLDGPAELHDQNRVDRAGRGTFDRVMRGVRLLQDSGLNPSVIAVVTKGSLTHGREFWQFFADAGITVVGLNPEEAEGSHERSSIHDDDSEHEFRAFVDEILTLGIGQRGYPRLREYDNFRQLASSFRTNQVRCHDNVPMAILSFDHRGNVSTFSPELLTARHEPFGDFLFGNVHDDEIDTIVESPKFTAVNKAVQSGVAKCQSECGYFDFCGGGSPSNKIAEAGTFDVAETRSCRLRVKVMVSAFVDSAGPERDSRRSES
ncbi:GRRM system radical SAM/SPASM domain protein [Streptomyces sp. A244]|uniref:GRRM system radical SAM/SPASM domain protein n=1 Tax=Streptomyces cahuitamycinicus TaxID=2070367 RepID=A0A2N8TXL4_9ACTN|nr:cyclophane-forming radical SAM/SPASM peptide maturase GrrM/OscB [Streptomyces sp. A244]PNG23752.1 GRRM system radical SAM/SPASM domain protein [Streptomyces cahuitamycinicus]PTH90412.1 GRRM system radical SAM/SPASM domain protein [Streptomyces sp. A244]